MNTVQQISEALAKSMSASKEKLISDRLKELFGIDVGLYNHVGRMSVTIINNIETYCFDGHPFIRFFPHEAEITDKGDGIFMSSKMKYEHLPEGL